MILHAPPFLGDQKILVAIQHTPLSNGDRKAWGLCYHFGKKNNFMPSFIPRRLKNLGRHSMVWVCRMAIKIF